MSYSSSFPTVIDLMLAKIRALSAITGSNPPVPVYDGMPGPNAPQLFIAIGGEPEPTEDGPVVWAELGNMATYEEYEVNCYIWSWIGGDDNSASTTSDAQKVARDNAFTLYNAIQTALLADPDLTIQNSGVRTKVVYMGVNHLSVHQTPVNTSDDGSHGRGCQIDWRVYVKARVPR